ncbi:Heat shock protein SSA4 [Entamoeba marina]
MQNVLNQSEFVLGIDLGTTFSCVAVWREQQQRVDVIPNRAGKETTPSVVSFQQQQRLIGSDAKNTMKGVIVKDTKRLIGRAYNDPVVQEDKQHSPYDIVDNGKNQPVIKIEMNNDTSLYEPEQISAMILKRLVECANDYLMSEVHKAVITVPAYFNDSQREATKNAGRIAGLEVIQILNEPTAAAIAYGFGKSFQHETNLLVFDLGGGTFDVTLLKMTGSTYVVQATNGDSHLGGDDFDQMLFDLVYNKWMLEDKEVASSITTKEKFKLRLLCEMAKRELSTNPISSVDLTEFYDDDDDDEEHEIMITREEFESANKVLFDKCFVCVESVLKSAQLSASQINEVVLVGGSTKIPKIQEMVHTFFHKIPSKRIDPDKAVAIGAALQAAFVSNQNNEHRAVLQDVTSHSIGLEVVGKKISCLIPRYTPLPARSVETYNTAYDLQEMAEFPIYEGEYKESRLCNLLDSFYIKNLPKLKKGVVKFRVVCVIDLNGMLTVSASVVEPAIIGGSAECAVQTLKERKTEEVIKHLKNKQDMLDQIDIQQKRRVLNQTKYNRLVKLCIQYGQLNIKNELEQLWSSSDVESVATSELLKKFEVRINSFDSSFTTAEL